MALSIETPSRIWRRIQEGEARDEEMPSLPPLPGFDNSDIVQDKSLSFSTRQTPNRTATVVWDTSLRRSSNSIQASRKEENPALPSKLNTGANNEVPVEPQIVRTDDESSDISLPSRPMYSIDGVADGSPEDSPSVGTLSRSRHVPDSDEDDDISLTEALASVSRTSSPVPSEPRWESNGTQDVPGSLSESILEKSIARNVAIRKYRRSQPVPDLSHSVSSLSSSTTTDSSSSQKRASDITNEAQLSIALDQDQSTTLKSAQSTSINEPETGTENCEDVRERTFSSEDTTSNITEVPKDRAVRFIADNDGPSGMSTPMNVNHNHQTRSPAPSSLGFDLDDLHTPLPRRKSFLLNVVNSSTRPRMSFGITHPHAGNQMHSGSTPGHSVTSTALCGGAGRRRLSHPLSQVHTYQTPSSKSSTGVHDNESTPSGINTSFVSTASSHDLTLHFRANTSFDPVTGAKGVERFNQTRLNTYLNGLNRQLAKENQVLREHAASLEQELTSLQDRTQRRGELSSVAEDAAEQWLVDKEALENQLKSLNAELEARAEELDKERNDRKRDKELWKGRMAEVEEGVGQIVRNLEKKLEAAEERAKHLQNTEVQAKDAEAKLSKALAECELLKARSEQTERLVETTGDVGPELRKISDERDELQRKVASMDIRLRRKEDEITGFTKHVDQLSSELASSKLESQELRSKVQAERSVSGALHSEVEELEAENRVMKAEICSLQSHVADLKTSKVASETEAQRCGDRLKQLDVQLSQKDAELERTHGQVAMTSNELQKTKDEVRQLEFALEKCEEREVEDGQKLAELRAKITSLEKEKSMAMELTQALGKSTISDGEQYQALKQELEAANVEVGRLNALLQQSPARKAIDKARDTRIELLEKQNKDLIDGLWATRGKEFTPRRNTSMSGFSPMHRHLINLSMQTPKTPGAPLRDVSWLLNTPENVSTAHLLAEIGRLQAELDFANESVDNKLDKLEETGFGVIDLTRALEDARKRIAMLEDQVRSVEEREFTKNEICKNCSSNPLASESVAALRHRLTSITEELESLRKQREEEILVSSDKKAVLQNVADRLTAEMKKAKEEVRIAIEKGMSAEKEKAEQQLELAKARRAIHDLEHQLHCERSQLRSVNADITRATQEKDEVFKKLRDTEMKMEDARDYLLHLKETNIRLESELRVGQRVEDELARNIRTIDDLRKERSKLSDLHFDLQQQLADATKTVNDLSTKHSQLQRSYNGRRRQLSTKSKEVEDLRAALSSQSAQLDKLRKEKERIIAEHEDVQAVIATLETDLKRIQREAETFGNDLKRLAVEKDMMETRYQRELAQHERVNKQNRAQIRIMKEQLEKVPTKLVDQIMDSDKLHALKVQHKAECKGLIVQIRYLKAKFTRENDLRTHLTHQKEYLLVLLTRYERSEKKILATIAQAGLPQSSNPRRHKSLRAAAFMVMFIVRASRSSEQWREQRSSRATVLAAYANVRQSKNVKE